MKNYKIETLRKKIGVVPQKAVLFRGTIRDNMKMGNENATDEMIYRALETAQAMEVVEKKKEGLDAKIQPERKESVRRTKTEAYHCKSTCEKSRDIDFG